MWHGWGWDRLELGPSGAGTYWGWERLGPGGNSRNPLLRQQLGHGVKWRQQQQSRHQRQKSLQSHHGTHQRQEAGGAVVRPLRSSSTEQQQEAVTTCSKWQKAVSVLTSRSQSGDKGGYRQAASGSEQRREVIAIPGGRRKTWISFCTPFLKEHRACQKLHSQWDVLTHRGGIL